MDYKLETNVGNRKINEDNINCNLKENSSFFALADGLGGHSKGEVASQIAVDTSIGIHKESKLNGFELLTSCFDKSQDAIMEEQSKTKLQMKTTLVLAEICDGSLYCGHIGDSRLYVFRNKEVLFQTKDHSVPQMMVAMGEIKEKDIRNHIDRNKLLKAMGEDWDGKARYQLASKPINLDKGDAILMATDGFWELIDEKTMIKMLEKTKSADNWVRKMTAKVERNGRKKNMDNYSVIGVIY